MSGLKERPSGKAILQNKASQHPVHPTRTDGRDAYFVVANGSYPLSTISGQASLAENKQINYLVTQVMITISNQEKERKCHGALCKGCQNENYGDYENG